MLNAYSSFSVEISLTKYGLLHYDEVVDAVFSYANNLKEQGPQKYIYEEMN
jgi:secreted Zn-dependent insulinase-like peptidase